MTDTVDIPVDVAEVAYRELHLRITETNAGDDPMTPLARAWVRVITNLDIEDPTVHDVAVQVMDIIEAVGEDTSIETDAIDPLQVDVYHARDELAAAITDDWAEEAIDA